jgi:methylated-DNA-[protein]-cysteine S-methyltransferase
MNPSRPFESFTDGDDAHNLFAAIPEVDPETNARLHAALVAAAAADGLIDIAYRTIDTPVGQLLLAATGKGLVRVAYPQEGHDRVLTTLAERISPRILRAPGRLDEAAREFDQYFTGTRKQFDIRLDTQLSRGFRRNVLTLLPTIDYGTTASYAEIAQLTDNPKAVRAVGSACATNPLPVVIPCHRVLRSDGGMGGYVGGLDAKRTLLALESARERRDDGENAR